MWTWCLKLLLGTRPGYLVVHATAGVLNSPISNKLFAVHVPGCQGSAVLNQHSILQHPEL